MDLNKEKIALDPATLLSPVPVVLVSCCGKSGPANLITIAWAGTVCSSPPQVSISVRKERHSHQLISESGEFVINLVPESLLWATDFCGVKSGRDLDKFAACRLHALPAAGMAYAPAVAESPLNLSCQVRQVVELGSHDCFIAEIIAAQADPTCMDGENRLRLDLAKLTTYCHGEYFALGRKLGFYGYSVARPEVLARRNAPAKRKGKR